VGMVQPLEFHDVDALPDRPELVPFFEAVVNKFPLHFLTEIRFPLSVQSMFYPATKSPVALRFIDVLFEKWGNQPIKRSLRDLIYRAAEYGLKEILDRLLRMERERGIAEDLGDSVCSATISAVRGGQTATLDYVSGYWEKAFLDDNSAWWLQEAAERADLEVLKCLVSRGCLPAADDKTLFSNAIKTGKLEIIELPFSHGLRLPDKPKELYRAAKTLAAAAYVNFNNRGDSKAIIEFLVSQDGAFWSKIPDLDDVAAAGASSGIHAWTARYAENEEDQAWGRDQLQVIHDIVDRCLSQADAGSAEGRQGIQNLLLAACRGSMPLITEKVLKLGADPEVCDDGGKSALELADHKARQIILGTPKMSPEIFKLCSMKVLLHLDADVGHFPEERVERARNFSFDF
jgi:hypothetical protein